MRIRDAQRFDWVSPAAWGCERETYGDEACLYAGIHHVGWSHFARAEPHHLDEHRHPGAYEICYIVEGETTWWAGDSVYEVQPGSLFINRPNEPHGGVDGVMQPCELYWIQAGPVAEDEIPPSLWQAIAGIPLRTWPGSPGIARPYQRMILEMRKPRAFSSEVVIAMLRILLIDIVRLAEQHMTDSGATSRGPSRRIQRAMKWISEQIGEAVSVTRAAEIAGLRPTHFRSVFREETGFSPQEYIHHVRIRHARKWLIESDTSITAIAHRLGYSSSQHFAIDFRKRTGLSPTEYRTRRRMDDRQSGT